MNSSNFIAFNIDNTSKTAQNFPNNEVHNSQLSLRARGNFLLNPHSSSLPTLAPQLLPSLGNDWEQRLALPTRGLLGNSPGFPPPGDHRHYEDDNEWGCGSWLEYTLVVVLSSVLLLGSLGLTLFWVIQYRGGFAWREDPKRQFNLHPVLMVAGFITFSGFSVLLYRICRCCRRIYVKLLHTVFHALAIPCVALGFLSVLDSHNLAQPPIPNFYSLHSWIGLVTMGLFAIQFVVGFFSFLILLCCEGATAGFRAALVPIHASFGLTTFVLAIAASVTGLTEKALFTLG
ncbi:hypothetical protein YQE_00162, partial [Dendroctonus ponderosae]